jgi:hypothetical protein
MTASEKYKRQVMLKKEYVRAGIPEKYWRSRIFEFSKLHEERCYKNDNIFVIEPEKQEEYFKHYQKKKQLSKNYIICATSRPTDDQALFLGASFAKEAIAHNKNTIFFNSSDKFPFNFKPDVLIIYNISVRSTNGRIQKVKDLLYSYKNAFRLLIVGGSNPIDFGDNYLYTAFDGVFYMQKRLYASEKSY